MDIRDKVIKGLECCQLDVNKCLDCPYLDKQNIVAECGIELHNDALALLKEQEAVKPVPAIDDVGDWLCGKCYNSVVGTEELDAGGLTPIRFNYCPNCGRAVKWG